ncbi:LssY C-terminal domain-containing protein [Schaalia sp. JY-X169]|uniref:LssY C-terminal domain-containing protein n=1 Tax=Schaalia sp. JY-X169 TaxID=2758572 RepID=UPI0015F47C49|nr:LssY C-terminal domain-containing protein [Schaalia sp. JY-X169]
MLRKKLVTYVNTFFFLFAGFAALWLVVLAVVDTRGLQWEIAVYAVVAWAVIAYVFLPRLYKLMTAVFLPDYFIGRARTSSGLLGDVVNMAWDGPEDNIHSAMQAAGWTLATPITLGSALGIIRSVLTRSPDPDAPISPLFLFGRKQDFAYQKEVGGSANQRHHIRFWKCPPHWPLPGGTEVDWLAGAAFDTGVRLSSFTLQVTHAISGDIDKERDFTISSLKGVDPGLKVTWIEKFSTAFHARNGGGDMVHTDGNLPIVDVETLPASIPQVHLSTAKPPAAKTLKQKLAQTKRPATIYVATFFIMVSIMLTARDLVAGTTISPALSWVSIGVLVLLWPALYYGMAPARWLLMVLFGVDVLVHLVAWFQADFVVNASTGVAHVGVATIMLVILSSDPVTDFTATISSWWRAK